MSPVTQLPATLITVTVAININGTGGGTGYTIEAELPLDHALTRLGTLTKAIAAALTDDAPKPAPKPRQRRTRTLEPAGEPVGPGEPDPPAPLADDLDTRLNAIRPTDPDPEVGF